MLKFWHQRLGLRDFIQYILADMIILTELLSTYLFVLATNSWWRFSSYNFSWHMAETKKFTRNIQFNLKKVYKNKNKPLSKAHTQNKSYKRRPIQKQHQALNNL